MKSKRRQFELLPRMPVGGVRKLIKFHRALDRQFDAWASDCRWKPLALRKTSINAIRTRHHQARIDHVADLARGRQPDVYHLSLGSIEVIYTVELNAVIIRGYAWKAEEGSDDESNGGGYFHDYNWHRRSASSFNEGCDCVS